MCGDPGKIFHVFGWRFVEGTREGATVTYSCVKGLVLVDGDEVRTCLSTGEWSGQLPRCTGEQVASTSSVVEFDHHCSSLLKNTRASTNSQTLVQILTNSVLVVTPF
jgi:hypothetical protein